ncbi:hypothetical protein [Nocardia asteroides]|uniref:hypothetical protein n=1 Tax=Nocardia asteroides TaxID=1824 RepID=UPI001E4B89E6|nr:hypothetical protein [Nocardia asteroides]UGT60867.1 hypothetical protein LTT61_27570 [Nocardia asteroides]
MVVAAVATALCCALKLWADVTTFADEEFWLPLGLLIAVPVAVWSVLIAIGCVRYANWWRLGLLVPLFVAVTVALAGFAVPGRIGWQLARSEMDRAAAECDTLQGGQSDGSYRSATIGVYDFHHVESGAGGECEFYLSKHYPGVRSGFLYLPNGAAPVSDIDHEYVRLGDSWYYFKT